MPNIPGKNKILTYLVLTTLMVVTFMCALAINAGTYSTAAWLVLLGMNLALIIYLLRD